MFDNMQTNIDAHLLARLEFRDSHPPPTSPSHRRLPTHDAHEEGLPSLIGKQEQARRATIRSLSRTRASNNDGPSGTNHRHKRSSIPAPSPRAIEEANLTRPQIAQRIRRNALRSPPLSTGRQDSSRSSSPLTPLSSSPSPPPSPTTAPPVHTPGRHLIDLRTVQPNSRQRLRTRTPVSARIGVDSAAGPQQGSSSKRALGQQRRRERERREAQQREKDRAETQHASPVPDEHSKSADDIHQGAHIEAADHGQLSTTVNRQTQAQRRRRIREKNERMREEKEREERRLEAAENERQRRLRELELDQDEAERARRFEDNLGDGTDLERHDQIVRHHRGSTVDNEQEQEEQHHRQVAWRHLPGQRPNPFLHTEGNLCAARRPYTDTTVILHDLGPMDSVCPHCQAPHWIEERTDGSLSNPLFGMCCLKGQVRLDPLPDPPQVLRDLLEHSSSEAQHFRENIASYNAALAFTSVGVKTDDHVNHVGRGQPVFRIHGELRHWSGTLLAAPNESPVYAQLYILDPRAAHEARMQRNSHLDDHVMHILEDMLDDVNPYIGIYQQAHRILDAHPNNPNYHVRLRLEPGQDRRRYNEPRADEVAVLIPDDENIHATSRDIILRLRNPDIETFPLQRVRETHPAYAPLHYVLLFPYGESGWGLELALYKKHNDIWIPGPRHITACMFGAYRLHTHRNEYPRLQRSGRLFHRWLVDMWAITDQQRLLYLQLHQKQLRAEVYRGLADAITAGDTDLQDIGRKVVLPSSYTGGPRYMHQHFQDAMALVRYYHKIDLFTTVTANPNWPEILVELLPRQTPYDRPELVARIFKLKKEAIIEDIYKNGIFGQAVAYIYTIEFQKRGLPHMHLLIILKDGYKLRTPEDVDTCIRATWPDPVSEPELFEVVKSHMVHGPCGMLNPRSPCMEDGRCQKNFPKEFQEETSMDERGYPKYRRPRDGPIHRVGRHDIDCSWIVPYSPFLSRKYNCHINVECAATVAAVKYTVKYVHKGGDRGSLEVGNDNNEIRTFLEGRYFSCSEAAWRLFEFKIHKQQPPVISLQVHLEAQQMVTFDPNGDAENIAERAAFTETSLTAFFALNSKDPDAHQYLYHELPHFYVFEKANFSKNQPAVWKPRKEGFSIGRMYFVAPNAGERFFLRKLLTVVHGPTSFVDLRTFNGTVYLTFREACLARGLLSDDREWHNCLAEAALFQTGHQLRLLLSTLLLFCQPAKPERLWQSFRADICDDLAYHLRQQGFTNLADDM